MLKLENGWEFYGIPKTNLILSNSHELITRLKEDKSRKEILYDNSYEFTGESHGIPVIPEDTSFLTYNSQLDTYESDYYTFNSLSEFIESSLQLIYDQIYSTTAFFKRIKNTDYKLEFDMIEYEVYHKFINYLNVFDKYCELINGKISFSKITQPLKNILKEIKRDIDSYYNYYSRESWCTYNETLSLNKEILNNIDKYVNKLNEMGLFIENLLFNDNDKLEDLVYELPLTEEEIYNKIKEKFSSKINKIMFNIEYTLKYYQDMVIPDISRNITREMKNIVNLTKSDVNFGYIRLYKRFDSTKQLVESINSDNIKGLD